jgi:hypothetical protein
MVYSVVFATPTADVTHCQLFRTYSSRRGFLDCTFVEAACATLSISSHFSSVSIGPHLLEQTFASASFGFNNPTREMIKEAEVQFGSNTRVSTILSIGSGHTALISFNVPEPARYESLKGVAADCEQVARELAAQLFNVDAYLRLNVDRGMENMELSDWKGPGTILGYTSAYLEVPAVTKAIDSSIGKLQDKVGSVTLGQLSRFSSFTSTARLRFPRPIQRDQDTDERRTRSLALLCGAKGILGCDGASSCRLPRSEAKDTRVIWNGWLREDTDGGLFRSGAPLPVSPSLFFSQLLTCYAGTSIRSSSTRAHIRGSKAIFKLQFAHWTKDTNKRRSRMPLRSL